MVLWTIMCEWLEPAFAVLWSNAIVIVPLAGLAYIISLIPRSRPATRHGAWLVALCWCLLPPVLPAFRVQIDDHTPLTPLSVPYSADGGSTSESPPSVGSISTAPVIDATQSSEASSFGQTAQTSSETCGSSIIPAIISVNRDLIDVTPHSHPPEVASTPHDSKSACKDSKDLALQSTSPTSSANHSHYHHRDSPISSFTDMRLGFVERQGLVDDVECTNLAPCDSPLPWNPQFNIAAAPTDPTNETPKQPDSATNDETHNRDEGNSAVRGDSFDLVGENGTTPSASPDTTYGWMPILLRRWVVGLIGVRDAMGRLPAIPVSVWLAGTILTAFAFVVSALNCRTRLRHGAEATSETCQLVALAAKKMGIARPPRVLMMSRRMSPMIWCGHRPVLVLPIDLWNELDHTGRLAVLFHELAHLRRRDHLVCRVSIAAACLYWWNPLVWWMRSRLHEEAEICCDAWVTWLLPKNRRTYADALIRTRQYLSCPLTLSPVLGMSTGNKSTDRFARRLTMVMTQRFAPRRGSFGVVVLVMLGLTGWVATPASSCPPNDKVRADEQPTLLYTPVEPTVQLAVAPKVQVDAPRPVVLVSDHGDAKNSDLEKKMKQLERHVEALTRQVQALAEATQNTHRRALRGELKTQENLARREAEMALQLQQGRRGGTERGAPIARKGHVIIKKYEMPEGILKAFIKLMARDDVPVLISPAGDHVKVHGTADQHAVVSAFITIISQKAEQQTRSYELSDGKLRDLSELMIRDDVPVRVRPSEEDIKVYGTPAEQAIFKAFVDLISPTPQQRQRAPRASVDPKNAWGHVYGQSAEMAAQLKRVAEAKQIQEATLADQYARVEGLHAEAQRQYQAAAKLEQAKTKMRLKKELEALERQQQELEKLEQQQQDLKAAKRRANSAR